MTLYRFFEHDQPIVSVSFKFNDDFAIIKDTDGFIFVWQLKTGHLDRVESGAFAEDILAGCDLTIPIISGNDVRKANPKQSISAFCLLSESSDEVPLGMVYLINLKRFISSLHASAQTASASKLSKVRRVSEASKPFSKSGTTPFTEEPDRSLELSDSSLNKGSFDLLVLENLLCISLPAKVLEVLEGKRIFSGKKTKRNDEVSSGIRGGLLSLASPTYKEDLVSLFSPTSTAFNLIRMFSLLKSHLVVKGREEEFLPILKLVLDEIRSNSSKGDFIFPSFSFLAKYWQDPIGSGDLQHSVRGLFSYTLAKMSTEEKNVNIEYWRPHLPAIAKKTSKNNVRATVILGVIGSEDPTALSIRY
ncbi:hypothetical protein HDU97_006980 [Phlyctochytrium planicorne]|nr:hypothetical protein HDU97_006980 [Phlyctochytrium planicorne]